MATIKLSSLMHLIIITTDHKDATIAKKQSYQGKKNLKNYYPARLWKLHLILKRVKQH